MNASVPSDAPSLDIFQAFPSRAGLNGTGLDARWHPPPLGGGCLFSDDARSPRRKGRDRSDPLRPCCLGQCAHRSLKDIRWSEPLYQVPSNILAARYRIRDRCGPVIAAGLQVRLRPERYDHRTRATPPYRDRRLKNVLWKSDPKRIRS